MDVDCDDLFRLTDFASHDGAQAEGPYAEDCDGILRLYIERVEDGSGSGLQTTT